MVHSHTNPLFDTAVFKLCALCGTLGFVLIIFFKALPVLVPCCPALPALFWFGERHYVCDMGGISLKHKIWKKPAVSSTKYNGYVESWSILISPLKPFFSGRKINDTDHGCTHLCRDRERETTAPEAVKLTRLMLIVCTVFMLIFSHCLHTVESLQSHPVTSITINHYKWTLWEWNQLPQWHTRTLASEAFMDASGTKAHCHLSSAA